MTGSLGTELPEANGIEIGYHDAGEEAHLRGLNNILHLSNLHLSITCLDGFWGIW